MHHDTKALLDCMAACDACVAACLDQPDRANCVRLCLDCADLCVASARLMARGSRFHQELCALCADIAEACAAECEKYDEEHCRSCAEACHHCAAECRKMA